MDVPANVDMLCMDSLLPEKKLPHFQCGKEMRGKREKERENKKARKAAAK